MLSGSASGLCERTRSVHPHENEPKSLWIVRITSRWYKRKIEGGSGGVITPLSYIHAKIEGRGGSTMSVLGRGR